MYRKIDNLVKDPIETDINQQFSLDNIRIKQPLADTKLEADELKNFVNLLNEMKSKIIQLNQRIDSAKSILSHINSTPEEVVRAINDIKSFSSEQRKLNELLKEHNQKLHYYLREIKLSEYGAEYDDLVNQSIDSSYFDRGPLRQNNLYHEYETNRKLKENIDLLCDAKDIIKESDSIMRDYTETAQMLVSNFLDDMYDELLAIEQELVNDPVFNNAFEADQSSIYGKDRDNKFLVKSTYQYRSKNESETTDETMLFIQQAKDYHKKNKGDDGATVLKQCQNYHRDRYYALFKRNEAIFDKIEKMDGLSVSESNKIKYEAVENYCGYLQYPIADMNKFSKGKIRSIENFIKLRKQEKLSEKSVNESPPIQDKEQVDPVQQILPMLGNLPLDAAERAGQLYSVVQKDIDSAEMLADALLKMPLQEEQKIMDYSTMCAFSLLIQNGGKNESLLKEIKDNNKNKSSVLKGKWKEIQSLYGDYHHYIATIAAKKGGRGIGVPANDALHHYKRLTEISGKNFARKSRQQVIDDVESYIEMKYMVNANDLNQESERILLNLVEAEYSKKNDRKGLLWPKGGVNRSDKKSDDLTQSFVEDNDESLYDSEHIRNTTPQGFYQKMEVDWVPDYLDSIPLPEVDNNKEKIFYYAPGQSIVDEQDNSDKTADYQQLCKDYAALPQYARDWAEKTLKTLEIAAWEAYVKKYSADFEIDFEVDMLDKNHPEVKQGVAEALKLLLLKIPNEVINSNQFVDVNQMKAMDTLLKKSAKNQHKRSLKTAPKCENDILRIIKMSNGDSWYNKPSRDWGNINQRYGSYLGYVTAMMQVPGARQSFSVAYGAYHTLLEIIKKGDKKSDENASRELISTYIDQLFKEQSSEANDLLYFLLKEKLATDKQDSKKSRFKNDKPANLAATIFVERYEEKICEDYFARLTDKSFGLDERVRGLRKIKARAPDIAEKLCQMLRKVDDNDVREILVAYEEGLTPQYPTDDGARHDVYHQNLTSINQFDDDEDDEDKIYDEPVSDKQTPGNTAGYQDDVAEQTPQYPTDDGNNHDIYHQDLQSESQFDKNEDEYDEMQGNTVGYREYNKEKTPQYYTDDSYSHYTYHQNLVPIKQFIYDDEDDEMYEDPDKMTNSPRGQEIIHNTTTMGEPGFHGAVENQELGRRLLALEDHYEELEEIFQDSVQTTKGSQIDTKMVSNLVADAINNIDDAWRMGGLSDDDKQVLRDKGKELEEIVGKLIDKNLLKSHEYKGQVISDKEDAMFSGKKDDDSDDADEKPYQFTKSGL